MTAEAWDRDYAVNVRSHMLFAQKALETMSPGGAIILTSSMASQRANGRNPAYESSKAAQIALARAIARAGEEKGVRCNVIAPGFIDTSMGRDASRRRADRAVTVPFGRQGHRLGGRLPAALFLISNEFPTSTPTHCFSMRVIWRGSCAASLRGPNGCGHCARRCNAQLFPHTQSFRKEDMSTPTKLFEPYKLGPITLPNRLAMAPLTRNRAVPPGMVPSPLAVDYYSQRASAGLLISEASQVSQQGQGYQDTPGIYSKEQVAGWKKVADRVHERGGRIFIQLWHVGRVSHTSLQPDGGAPVAPSAIRAKGKTFVNGIFTDISEPRALELSEIPGIIKTSSVAGNALAARFDGVKSGANGYLLDQFAKTAATSAATPMADRSRTARG
jgi:hypothetical protein